MPLTTFWLPIIMTVILLIRIVLVLWITDTFELEDKVKPIHFIPILGNIVLIFEIKWFERIET